MTLKQRLQNGDPVFGTMVRMVRNPAIIPVVKASGLDFVMFDVEHGAYTLETLAAIAMIGRAEDFPVLARVPELSRAWVSGALDTGLAGIMVPMVETAEQARQLVAWSKYPPLGERGFSSSGGHTGYTSPGPIGEFLATTNDEVITIAQIETVSGVENADAITCTEGIDVILAGPNDLANSLGNPGNIESPEEIEALERIARAVADAGSILGTHTGDGMLKRLAPLGLKFFMNSLDIAILGQGFTDVNERTRRFCNP